MEGLKIQSRRVDWIRIFRRGRHKTAGVVGPVELRELRDPGSGFAVILIKFMLKCWTILLAILIVLNTRWNSRSDNVY